MESPLPLRPFSLLYPQPSHLPQLNTSPSRVNTLGQKLNTSPQPTEHIPVIPVSPPPSVEPALSLPKGAASLTGLCLAATPARPTVPGEPAEPHPRQPTTSSRRPQPGLSTRNTPSATCHRVHPRPPDPRSPLRSPLTPISAILPQPLADCIQIVYTRGILSHVRPPKPLCSPFASSSSSSGFTSLPSFLSPSTPPSPHSPDIPRRPAREPA